MVSSEIPELDPVLMYTRRLSGREGIDMGIIWRRQRLLWRRAAYKTHETPLLMMILNDLLNVPGAAIQVSGVMSLTEASKQCLKALKNETLLWYDVILDHPLPV
ncbi:hypothetical protein MPER_10659 [Moniliophthora perniciosa FA553]|nr:hypothetical protein MPER_10659 [Moniliophthora perniciosa FA553]